MEENKINEVNETLNDVKQDTKVEAEVTETEEVELVEKDTTNKDQNHTVIPDESLGIDVEKENKRAKVFKVIKYVIIYAFLTLFAAFAILPFYWMIISSLKTDAEYRQTVPSFFPEAVNWVNYKIVIEGSDNLFSTILVNTLIVGIVSTILSVILTIVTAFAFAKLKFKGKSLLFTILLATMMIPGELFTTTNYVTVSSAGFGWNNTYTVLIVPFMVSVFYIYLLRNTMMQIPDSLYQAAKVDGAGDLRFLVKVMIPLTSPTIISITLLKLIGTWNSYIWPQLVNKNENWQLLSNWVSGGFKYQTFDQASQTLKMAAACMVTLPLLILFILFRKYIMRGVSRSGTKG